MTAIERAVRTTEQLASEATAALIEAASLAFASVPEADDATLPPAVRARLDRDAARARALYDSLAGTRGVGQALRDAATIARDVGDRLLALAALVDRLADEAEALGGSRAGRGAYKRQQVKAALLYAAQRGGYAIPLVPSFLDPALFSIGADVVIDFVVAHINAHDLWQPRGPAASPLLRIAAPFLLAVRAAMRRVSASIAGLSWSLVLLANRLSPRLRRTVDRMVAPDDAAIRAFVDLRRFLEAHPRFVTDIAALFGIATRQAELLTRLDGPQKQAYARELILIVLRQQGLVGRSPLLDRIVETIVTIGIDATVAIFSRRGLFA